MYISSPSFPFVALTHNITITVEGKPRQDDQGEAASTTPQEIVLPIELRYGDNQLIILWVENDFCFLECIKQGLKPYFPQLGLVKVASAHEAGVWLSNFGPLVESRLVVITNRARDLDGGELAWERVVNQVRDLKLNKTPVVVFCGRTTCEHVTQLAKSRNNVHVTSEAKTLLNLLVQVFPNTAKK